MPLHKARQFFCKFLCLVLYNDPMNSDSGLR
jgi:hypothetical protein